MKIINFKNDNPQTPFAPIYSHFLAEINLENVDYIKLKSIILNKEKELLNIKSNIDDGKTNLGENSLTSRHKNYNIFNWPDEPIQKLKSKIKTAHKEFLNKIGLTEIENVMIKGWANVMRKEEQINIHLHDNSGKCYLGGHYVVSAGDTYTYYQTAYKINELKPYASKNDIGKLTLFSNCIPHWTSIHNEDNERITIAFDLILEDNNERGAILL